MSTRLVPALVVGIVLLVTACSSSGESGDGTATEPGDQAAGTSTASGPTFTQFADFPGRAFKTTEPGLDLGMQVKVIDAEWRPELAGVSADPGKHYLAVYVAVTGELADRGVQAAKTQYLQLRYDNTAGENCDPYSPDEVPQHCFREANPASDLQTEIADDTWRDQTWQSVSFTGRDIEQGETAIGVVGFDIEDSAKVAGLQLCGPTKDDSVDTATFPCAPVPEPEGARG